MFTLQTLFENLAQNELSDIVEGGATPYSKIPTEHFQKVLRATNRSLVALALDWEMYPVSEVLPLSKDVDTYLLTTPRLSRVTAVYSARGYLVDGADYTRPTWNSLKFEDMERVMALAPVRVLGLQIPPAMVEATDNIDILDAFEPLLRLKIGQVVYAGSSNETWKAKAQQYLVDASIEETRLRGLNLLGRDQPSPFTKASQRGFV